LSFRRKPESNFFNWLQSFWTPVFTGVTTFYETINDIREYQDEASWFFLQLITRQNNTYHLFFSSNKHAMDMTLDHSIGHLLHCRVLTDFENL